MNGLIAAVAWLGALCLHGLAGPQVAGARFGAAVLALAVLAVHGWSRNLQQRGLRHLAAAACVLAAAALPVTLARGSAYAGAVALLCAPGLAGLGAGLFLAALGTALLGWIPGTDSGGAAVASWLGNAFTPGPGDALSFGPSAAALPAALWVLALLAVLWPRRTGTGRRWVLLGALAVPLALALQWAAAAAWHDHLGPHAGHGHPAHIFESMPWALAGLAGALWLGWGRGAAPGAAAPLRLQRRDLRAAGLGLGAGAVLALALSGWRGEGAPDRRLAVLNMGGLDWDRPTFQELGAFSGGMFGQLPLYLRNAGWDVQALPEEELPGFSRARAQVLVLINCHKTWSEDERRRLEEFVRDGGSILVLGDHTDVFGLMRGCNTLLEPWGVTFRFDSAYHTGQGWADDVEWKPGILGHWQDPRAAGIAIGASLELAPPARSLIQARYAFSDLGYRENVMGSYLGDYAWERKERLGDLSLLAGLRLGRGRVVVYGDTSGYQNGGLPWFFAPHVEPLLSQLARRPALASPYALEAAAAALALLGALLLALHGGGAAQRTMAGAGVALVLGAAASPRYDAAETLRRSDLGRALLVDQSQFPEVGHYEARWNTLGPLETGAARSGLFAYHLHDWDGDVLRRARAVAFVGPREEFSHGQVRTLEEALRAGATVLVAASAPDAAGARPLLRHFGVDVEAHSLGPVPPEGRQAELEPRFVNASPLQFAPETRAESLYRYGEPVLAAAVPVDRGWLLVFGDTRFFSNDNIEGMWGWWGGNLRFLHDVFVSYLDGAPEQVKPVFGPPVRPEGE